MAVQRLLDLQKTQNQGWGKQRGSIIIHANSTSVISVTKGNQNVIVVSNVGSSALDTKNTVSLSIMLLLLD